MMRIIIKKEDTFDPCNWTLLLIAYEYIMIQYLVFQQCYDGIWSVDLEKKQASDMIKVPLVINVSWWKGGEKEGGATEPRMNSIGYFDWLQ